MILNIIDAANDVDNRAEVAKSHFRNRKLAVYTKQYAEIGQLLVPIQKLLARELDAIEELIVKGKELPNFGENLWCYCKVNRQYLLPCRHIFYLDTEIKVLTTVQWKVYLMMFEECGMEVYETMGTIWVKDEGSGRSTEKANIIGRVRERFEQDSEVISMFCLNTFPFKTLPVKRSGIRGSFLVGSSVDSEKAAFLENDYEHNILKDLKDIYRLGTLKFLKLFRMGAFMRIDMS
ncbi:hypothetical protein BGX38DRAFT_1144581 [Terfezia claveryi]|nr:hypothetical protein BGX38DRAFT_1144581 [Terfezia claveryi]